MNLRIVPVTFALVSLACLPATAQTADPAELVAGVSQITAAPGLAGPVHPMSQAWWSIAAGDDDATFPSLFVAAREYGAGRVVIVGHSGVVTSTGAVDNGAFMMNVMNWLDVSGTGELRYTTGHGEWVTAALLSGLAELAAGQGMTLSGLAAPIDSADLVGVSVLIAGSAWGDFTDGEIEAARQWVENGGGLLLVGLGWSWEPYHPGTTIEDYPMMKLAEPYEVRWLRTAIVDATNQHEGKVVFHVFYPEIEIATIEDSISAIEASHTAHGVGLVDALESDGDLRFQFVRAHQTLAIAPSEFPADHPDRSDVFDGYVALATAWPGAYARGFAFDEAVHPTSAWIRERTWRTWRDCLELTPERKALMILAGQITGPRLDVFADFGVVLLDNDRLSATQWSVIDGYLTLTPSELYSLRAISVRESFGTPPMQIPLSGQPFIVYVYGVEVGSLSLNEFPPDSPVGFVDFFSINVAHELNRVVDAFTIFGSEALSERRAMLVADAGKDPLNYLRSMAPPGFFLNNPQEFFTSIADQWFTDSTKTLELGLIRFDAGRPDPINQAIFFADVYSQGSDATWFYTTDTQGNIERTPIQLGRDPSGWIDSITVGPAVYLFELDAEGRVTAYSVADADINDDGVVNVIDLVRVLLCFGLPAAPGCEAEDVNNDGAVNVLDLVQVLLAFGTACP